MLTVLNLMTIDPSYEQKPEEYIIYYYIFYLKNLTFLEVFGKFYFEFAPFSCKFLFLLSFSFLLITWVNCHQIESFQCINISPGREKFETHLGFILGPLKG